MPQLEFGRRLRTHTELNFNVLYSFSFVILLFSKNTAIQMPHFTRFLKESKYHLLCTNIAPSQAALLLSEILLKRLGIYEYSQARPNQQNLKHVT